MEDQKQVEKRLTWLMGVVLVWAAFIMIRLVMLQVVHHRDYLRAARKAQEIEVRIPAMRGSIYDRNMRLLASSTRLDTVFVNPMEVPHVGVAAEILSRILNLDREELRKRLSAAVEKEQGYLVIKTRISPEESERLRELQMPWIRLDRQTQRHYPKDSLGAHILGFVNFEEQGSGGLEMSMESVLRGEPGLEHVLTDVKRRQIEARQDHPAKDGLPLVLTIDERIQFVMERELAAAVERAHGKFGSAVAMNPNTGQIYGLVSYPTFDPNRKPEAGESPAKRFNNAVGVPFEPGSVYKVITLTATLETTNWRPDTPINCGTGPLKLIGRVIHESHNYFGTIPMWKVLAKSSNIGAIQCGMKVGQANLYKYSQSFGIGDRTGVELPAESRGRLRKKWQPTTLPSVSIGHEVMVTTLQLARACSVIANGGMLVKPRLVLREGDRTLPMEQPVRVIRPDTAITMRKMMEGVVLEGTGRKARLEGYRSAGKTGTGKIADPVTHRYTMKYNATFMGFAPMTDPAIVIVVTVNGTHLQGADASAPAFKAIAEEALRILNVPKDLPDTLVADDANSGDKNLKADEDDAAIADLAAGDSGEGDDEEEAAAPATVAAAPVTGPKVPNFRGKTMRAVVEEASAQGFSVLLDGSGIARMQQPPPGSVLRPGERIRVQFSR
jgi:cell division protein FtsI (penicillin-binding protein 3)